MAFGVTRQELTAWKEAVLRGELAFITHYWLDERFPGITTVTKVGCRDILRLAVWCEQHQLPAQYIHLRPPYPHFDLIGPKQREILLKEGLMDQITRFKLYVQIYVR